jgi:hypothetical protein
MGEKLRKSKMFLSGINCAKRVARTWEMRKEVAAQDLTESMKMLKKCGFWYIQIEV